jgi:hypothetical protein
LGAGFSQVNMQDALYRIEPGQGIGSVKFGDSTEQLQKLFGLPDEIEDLDQATTFWRYSVLKLRFAFQSGDWPFATLDKRLVHFMTTHPATTLWGKRIIGRPKDEVFDMFREHGCGSFAESDEVVGPISYRTVRLEQLHLVLDFSDGLLKGVLWATRNCDGQNHAPDEPVVPRKR